WIEGIHPEDRPQVAESFERWLRSEAGTDWETEFRVVHRDGSVRWILERGVLLAPASSGSARVCGISIDITQRKLVEAALRESDERFALAVQGASVGIWDWDLLKGLMFLSPRTQSLFG